MINDIKTSIPTKIMKSIRKITQLSEWVISVHPLEN